MTMTAQGERPASELDRDELRERLGMGPPADLATPRRYLSTAELQGLLGFRQQKSLYNIQEQGGLLDPDVMVGPAPGWDPEWAFLWAVETGRLAHDGAPIRKKAGRRPKDFERPRWWNVEAPTRYLTTVEAARLLGLEDNSVYFRRARNSFLEPDVLVGSRLGWAEDRVRKFGHQIGRIPLDQATAAGLPQMGPGPRRRATEAEEPPLAAAAEEEATAGD